MLKRFRQEAEKTADGIIQSTNRVFFNTVSDTVVRNQHTRRVRYPLRASNHGPLISVTTDCEPRNYTTLSDKVCVTRSL